MNHAARYVLYARKSTDTEDKQILSIPAQLNELRQLCASRGITVSEELTEAYSAREPGRPVFSRLLKDVAAGRIHGIVCWKLDRLARNPIDGGAITHYLGKDSLREIITPDGTYTGSGDSKFMLSVLFGAATKMTDDLSVAVKRGNRAIHERGRITGPPPLGYIKVRDREGFRSAGHVVPDPERFELVKRVWHEVLTGTTTVHDVWRRARDEWGLTSCATRKIPSHPVHLNHVYSVLGNPFYTGQLVRCGEVYRGEHEPMVTMDEFNRVQELVRRPQTQRPSRRAFLYAGLLHCGDCGRLLTGERVTNHQGRHYIYYRCGRRRPGFARCYAAAPREDQVTGDVAGALERLQLPEPMARWVLEFADLWLEDQAATIADRTKCAHAALEQVERRLKRATDLVIDGRISEDEFATRRAELQSRAIQLRSAAANPNAELERWRETIANAVSVGRTLHTAFVEGDDAVRRRLLGRLCSNLLVKERKATPVLRSEYLWLAEQPAVDSTEKDDGSNLPTPRDAVRNLVKNARPRSGRERAFCAWYTNLVRSSNLFEPSV